MSTCTFASTTRWIWYSGEERPKNFYLHCRKTFMCGRTIRKAEISITADSRYQLFVNGGRVAAGPARSDRRWQCVDHWEITQHLKPGLNAIAVLVHHYGEWTFAYMLGRGGLLAEATITYDDGTIDHLGTDASWLVRPAEAWDRRLPRMSIQQGFTELFDARRQFEGWTLADFDASGWSHAIVLGLPGMEPWPNLVPREIPALTEIPVRPARVIDSGCVGVPPTGHYVDIHRVIWCATHGVAYLGTYIWSPAEATMEIHAGSQESLKLWFNEQLVINAFGKHDFAHDQHSVPVRINMGWNKVLAKVVQDEGQWHFGFRLEGKGSQQCRYANAMVPDPATADELSPWWILGPIQADSMQAGFDTPFPPETGWDPAFPVPMASGLELRWMSAGVTKESQIAAIVMSREPHLGSAEQIIRNPDGLLTPGKLAEFLPGGAGDAYIVLDFGKEVAGLPVLPIDGATGGEIIDIGYSELLSGPDGSVLSPAEGTLGRVNCDRHSVHYADRYICKPGAQEFRVFDRRAFRYMQINIRNLRQPLRIGPVTLLLMTYPVEYSGQFECSDQMLNTIWDIGRWTVQLNMEDAFTDCPWRERGQWWGDARIEALVNYYAFGDLALMRYGIRTMAHSQDDEGWTRGIYPTDWSYAILPTFSLLWIISLHDYLRFSGDRSLLADTLPVVEGILEACSRFRAEHGLLRNMPYWLFVDWAGVDSTGESASINALYHGALRAAAAIAAELHHKDLPDKYLAIAQEVRSGMKQVLWDPAKKCFHETWNDGVVSKEISEQANCWAVAFGVVEGKELIDTMAAVTREKQASVLIGTPYFSFYMLDALGLAGDHAQALEYIHKHWARLVTWGATTWWENWNTNGSLCHGWSSAPTYFLQAEILGVKPLSHGWREILVEPHPVDLTWARGKVPTPHGVVCVEWKTGSEFSLTIDVPVRTSVCLPLPADKPVIVRRINDNSVRVFETTTDLRGKTTFIISEPGKYTFT